MMKKNIQTNRGYTLLFAVLVSSILLSVGISILNISKKEFLIATSARDSSAAFYAADSGLECAIYADEVGSFTTETIENRTLACNVPYSIETVDIDNDPWIFVVHIKSGSTEAGATSALELAGKSCAVITVTKTMVSDGNGGERLQTIIDSRGYNTGWSPDSNPALALSKGTCSLLSAKRVERGLSYTY